jgi:beta-lactamase regulating signal transducer with metallopeptidase domain
MTALTLLESTFGAIVRASWEGTILAIVVLAVGSAFRRIPARGRCVLLLIVLVRFLLPLAPQSTISLFNLANVLVEPANLQFDDGDQRDFDAIANRASPSETRDLAATPRSQSAREPATSSAVGHRRAAPRLVDIAITVWLLGIATMLIRHVVLLSRSRRRRRYRKVHNGPALATLTECQRQLGIRRRVELFVTECHTAPALAGMLLPRILVSERTLVTLNPDQLAWLFRHELAHVRHGDVAIQYLWRWARVIHWFNPMVWWAAARARVEAELACDEFIVARASGSERIGYGNALLAVAEMMLAPNHVSGVTFLTRKPELVRRISLIAGYNRRSRLSALVSAPFIVGLAGVGLTDGVPRPPSPAQAATRSQRAQTPTVKAKANDQKNPARSLRIRVVGPDDKPLAGAKVFANIVTKDRKIVNKDYFSGTDGWAMVELPPAGTDILKLWASKDGYVKWFASWMPGVQVDGHLIPSDYTFHLEKATLIGQGQRTLKCCSGNNFQKEILGPATTSTFHGDAVAARVLLQE